MPKTTEDDLITSSAAERIVTGYSEIADTPESRQSRQHSSQLVLLCKAYRRRLSRLSIKIFGRL